jgi:hypothetical protein
MGFVGNPRTIAIDNGCKFASEVFELWAYTSCMRLPKPPTNGCIESLNGKPRDERSKLSLLFPIREAQRSLRT